MELAALRRAPNSGRAPRQLVLLCHGHGGDPESIFWLVEAWAEALPDAAFVAPRAPEICDLSPGFQQWWSLVERTQASDEAGVRRASATLGNFIDEELEREGVGPEGLALMGFSQGAMLALFAGLRNVPTPAAILAYAGALLAPDSLNAEIVGRPPVLIAHGTADDVVPVERSRSAESALRAAGIDVEALYPDRVGHVLEEHGVAAGARFLRRVFRV
jgi:phospholipase/carboxylesterase